MSLAYTIRINGTTHHFVEMRDGESVHDPPLPESFKKRNRMGGILESRRFPGVKSDRVAYSGIGSLHKQFHADSEVGARMLEHTVREAMRHGYRPNPNDVYRSDLARFNGDPEAFLSESDGNTAIRERVERRGAQVQSGGGVKWREPESDPFESAPPLADEIVQEEYQKAVAADPSVSSRDAAEVKSEIVEKYGPQK